MVKLIPLTRGLNTPELMASEMAARVQEIGDGESGSRNSAVRLNTSNAITAKSFEFSM